MKSFHFLFLALVPRVVLAILVNVNFVAIQDGSSTPPMCMTYSDTSTDISDIDGKVVDTIIGLTLTQCTGDISQNFAIKAGDNGVPLFASTAIASNDGNCLDISKQEHIAAGYEQQFPQFSGACDVDDENGSPQWTFNQTTGVISPLQVGGCISNSAFDASSFSGLLTLTSCSQVNVKDIWKIVQLDN